MTTFDNHVLGSHRAKGIDDQVTRGTLDAEDFTLAVLRGWEGGACCVVIVEKAVQTSTINYDVVAVQNTEAEGITVSRETVAVVGIIQSGVDRVRAMTGIWIGLVVSEKAGVSVSDSDRR